MKNECMGLINLDSIQNPSVNVLSDHRPVATIPIAGRYRLIDFTLSNMVNSGITNVGIYAREKYRSLTDHLGSGKDWDLSRKQGGLYVLSPENAKNNNNYGYRKGDIYTILANIDYIEKSPEEYVIVAPSYMICSIDYNDLLKYHKKSNNDITIVYKRVENANKDFKNCNTLNIDKDKLKAIEMAMGQIEKQFGKGSVMKLGEQGAPQMDAVSTGCLDLDIALGIGGVPKGRIIEIYGPESSGKTTVALHVVAEAQKLGGAAAYIDAEHALDPVYAKRLGVNIDDLVVSQPDTGEQALEITEALVRSGAIDVLVVDSVAALVPRAEIEGEMGDSHVGLQARLMSQALRKLTGTINKSNCVVIFINQLREKVGIMFGNPETTPGGRALKFYASVRMDIRRIDSIKQGDGITGNRTRVKIVKNKVAPPFKQAEFDIMYNEGISKEGNIVDVGVKENIVQKSGAWFSYGDIRLGQGRENAKQYLKENPAVALDIENQIREKYSLPLAKAVESTSVEENTEESVES